MLALAYPLVVAELGWVAMGVVDIGMVGRLPDGAVAIGGVGLASIAFAITTACFGAMMMGLDTLVSQSFGAGKIDDCNRSLWTALLLALGLTPVLMLVNAGVAASLPIMKVHPAVASVAGPYLRILNWSSPALMLYFVPRRYLQAISITKPIMYMLVTANLINLAANWIFIYGHWGAPAMGTDGSAWSSVGARAYLALMTVGFVLFYNRARSLGLFRNGVAWDAGRARRLLQLGLPVATHIGLEIGVFAAATALIARLDPVSLAAHEVALNLASVTFMVPLGISSAAAVRVGQALGRGDSAGAARAGWTAIGLGAAFMSCAAITFLTLPRAIAGLYTTEREVIEASVVILSIAAVFQLFDGVQVVASGALRGAGDTRTPMFANLVFYWFIGLPIGCWLCFRAHRGAAGLWVGLCLALVLVGSVLLNAWRVKVHDFPATHEIKSERPQHSPGLSM